MTLDSDDIRFMRIFGGVPWKGGVIQQWGNRKRVFSRFRTLRIRHLRKWGQHYYLVPCRLSTDPKIRDLEWLWMAWRAILRYMFTITNWQWLYFVIYLLYSLFITRVTNARAICDQRRSVGSGVANSDPHNNWNPQKIRGRYIVGTLTNNANIIVLLSALSPFQWLQNTWLWMTLNRHFALNSVLCRYVWSSEAWLSKPGYS